MIRADIIRSGEFWLLVFRAFGGIMACFSDRGMRLSPAGNGVISLSCGFVIVLSRDA